MPERTDANRLALRLARTLLEAAGDLTLEVDGTAVDVHVERRPPTSWPEGSLEGRMESTDGPWPRALQLTCTAKDGSGPRSLLVETFCERPGRYRGDVVLLVRLLKPVQRLISINLKLPLLNTLDGGECSISALVTIVKPRRTVPDHFVRELKAAVERAGFELLARSLVEVCRVLLPGLEMTPAPAEAFRRLVHIALLKLPFLVRGEDSGTPPFRALDDESSIQEELDADENLDFDEDLPEAELLPEGAPVGWGSDRLDLSSAQVQPHLGSLEFAPEVIEQACAALSSGKHLLLVGPPGTGKTELAHVLVNAARSGEYCRGFFEATASADWTTYETIGGYALERDQSLRFREGAFLRAVKNHQWLLVDELNRADVDKAFGELMTVLSGKGTDTPFELENGRRVSIGFDAGRSYRVSRTFRVIATMNTWDKTSLFRLSYAVQRRFAVLHIGIPTDDAFARLISRAALGPGPEGALDEATERLLVRLFQREGLLSLREVGPAIPLDMIRYLRRRAAGGIALAEAIAMFLLPQLEGLDVSGARKAYALFVSTLSGWTPPESLRTLRGHCEELWPPGSLPEA